MITGSLRMPLQKQLYSIFEDSNGKLWLASLSQGLFIFDPEQEKFWRYEKDVGNAKALHANMIVQISEDDEGTIWISDFNLCKVVFPGKHLDYGNLSFQYLALGEHDAIVQIHIDQQKIFWASSDTEGLYLIDTKEEKIVKKYAQKEGNQLIGEGVFGIGEDAGGNLWLFGASGVEKFDPERETFELFDHTSGFSFNPSGRKVSKNKEGWYCTMSIKNGFYIFHPDSIETNRIPPDVLITQFRLFNQTVQPGEGSPLSQHISKTKTVQLKYNENDIAFEYTALHYDRTEKVKYAYKMKGIDEDWVTVGHERIARYPKLPPGNYTFQVKAANADGIWNEQGASLSISISKPWWNTWLAYVLYAIGGAGVVFFLYTSELKKKLQQAEAQRLAELNVVKTRLYTNITHEFRTPLTIILGMADQININPGEWLSEGMDMIKRSGKTLLHLVNQMLDLSKLESGVMPLHLIQGDIVVYLKYLFESFHSTAENKNIQLDFLAEPKSLRMDYDPDKLLNIVFNLMANAIKYTPQGGTITMEVFREGGGRQLLKLIVRDTGTGIAPQNLPRIFDRFYQADEGQRNVGGAGIGLAIVHELITLMQGSISVESEVGQGTEFTLLLPITQKAPISATPSLLDMKEQLPFELLSEDVQADEKMVRTGEKPLLLVVEDNVDVVTYLSSFLMEEYQLLTAGNGRAGIELAIENIPDIILSDVMMPEKDGFELCQALKTDERTSHIPIILLTAKADIASKLEGLEFGADAYLTKPVNREELELRLRKLLESRKLLQEYYFKIYPEGDKKEVYQREDAFMEKLHEIMDAHLDDENFGIKDICQEMFISRMQLHRKLRALTGKTTSHYLRTYRLQKARKMLLNSNMTITEIAYEVGFKSPGYFSSSFTETFGKSPLEFRK
jgi:signal transduction histidine kinase/DNA-binding response OmpR family regulator/streptogramin lyase